MTAPQSSTVRIACAIPTRNRAEFAQRSIRSVQAAGLAEVTVLVSDNSTDDAERAQLEAFCASADQSITYVRPSEPMPMTDHWEWVVRQALADATVTHVLILTDRMAFRSGDLERLVSTVAAHPERVVSYHQDTVHDELRPIGVELAPWSDLLLEVSAQHLLDLSSRGVVHWSLPRMLNCVAPREALSRVENRYGSLFASISPDFCFAYRCLDVEESILALDRTVMVAYGLARSNGASYARGQQTQDRVDFAKSLRDGRMNASAPVPELHTIRNAVFNEYCFVYAEAASKKLRPVDPRGYLAALIEDMSLIEDPDVRRTMIDQLGDIGWVAGPRARLRAGLAAIKAMFVGWDAARFVLRRLRRVLSREPDSRIWRAWGRTPPTALLAFDSTDSALRYVDGVRGPHVRGLDHLPALTFGEGSARVVE